MRGSARAALECGGERGPRSGASPSFVGNVINPAQGNGPYELVPVLIGHTVGREPPGEVTPVATGAQSSIRQPGSPLLVGTRRHRAIAADVETCHPRRSRLLVDHRTPLVFLS